MLKVNEIFHSIQGESTHAGRPCLFIRLTACDLRCTYCDTEYAFYEGKPMDIEEILGRVQEIGCPLVEVTGGEPLLQEGVYELMDRLLADGYEVLLETSGHKPIDKVPDGVKIILDIKTPGSGMSEHNLWSNLPRLRPGDELKLVLCDRDDYDWAKAALANHPVPPGTPVLFSPSHGVLDPEDLAGWILEDKLPVRMQLQMHKHIWDPDARGV